MLRKKITFLSFALLIVFGCTPDRGTYNHVKLNEVEISGINSEEPYEVNRFNELSIPVDLEFKNGDDGTDFEYLWYMYIIGNEKIDTIGREKDLKYKFNELPGNYSIVYKVTDKKHDVYYHKNLNVRVINTIDEGFLILGAVDDSVHLSMVNKEGILSTDMYYGMRGKHLAPNPEKIFHFIPGNAGGYTGREYITVTYDGGKASLFDPINFIDVATEKDMFVLAPITYNIMGYNAGGGHDILINDHKIHTRRYYVPYNAEVSSDEKGYKASTISLSGGGYLHCIYDTMNRRFLTLNSGGSEATTMTLTKKSKPFAIENVQKDLIAGYCNASGFSSALMRDDNGALSILDYILRLESEVTKMQFVKEIPVASESPINSAKQIVFAAKDNVNFMLYFRENDSQIYLYDIMGSVDQESGQAIHDYKIMDINSNGGNYKIDKIFAAENRFAIAYTDNNATGKMRCGIVIFDVVPDSNIITLVEQHRYNNVTERIADIAYKFSTIKK